MLKHTRISAKAQKRKGAIVKELLHFCAFALHYRRNIITNIIIDISCNNNKWQELVPYVDSLVETSCRNAIHASGIADKTNTIEVSVLLTGDDFIQQLNKEYREQDKPTNVLSFHSEEFKAGEYDGIEEFVMLGDIAIALETIVREAEEQQKDIKHHLCHMTVHGTLHLLGYDHINDNDAETMEGLETKILADMGIANPYSEI